MAESKERGRPVEELTRDELLRERSRCLLTISLWPNRKYIEATWDRLRKIDERLRDLQT